MYSNEIYFNVWNCQAELKVCLWKTENGTSHLVESRTIPTTEEEVSSNVEHINFSGRYPVREETLRPETKEGIKKALSELESLQA